MKPRLGNVLGVVAALVIVLGVPAAAYAAGSKTLGFTLSNADFVSGQRVPASTSGDFAMPARGDGVFVSDIYGCPSGNAAYNSGLVRTVNNFPDQTILVRNSRTYCSLQLTFSGVSWPSGNYHFGVAPYYYPQPSGSGIVGTPLVDRVTDLGSDPTLEVSDLSHRYRQRLALDRVNLIVGRGVTTLLGPNGAGKTTMMRVVAGQLRQQSGSVMIDGLPVTRKSVARVAYLPQHPQIFDRFTCLEFVTYCAWLRGLPSSRAKRHAAEALEVVGLGDRHADRTRTLSGGMLRRLSIAAVLSARPRVVLLDEPMSGLDPEQQHDVRRVIKELGQTASVLVSTHVLQDVASLADHVCLVHQGRVAFDGHIIEFLGTSPQRATAEEVESAYVRRIGQKAGEDVPGPG